MDAAGNLCGESRILKKYTIEIGPKWVKKESGYSYEVNIKGPDGEIVEQNLDHLQEAIDICKSFICEYEVISRMGE